ncbi:Ig-like domain-containing protein [Lentibacillus cibarius]|uniref:BIG2 domain-containing protein n=1 Tax=Lentibacillus cibarius TaxID=2583219 RepID=A0A5S3QJ95_9BACI|nr:Ig-like domain-containing protein [Lentibacillus cibarius]TMN21908.1 hypothetical protein FFL34_07110 [Lentibacillus cibarius]
MTVKDQNGKKQLVKSVDISDANDGSTTLNVEFYDDLKSGETYTFSVDVDGETISKDLEFEIAEVGEIQAEDQVISNGDDLSYTVLDENGLDITDSTEVEVNSNKDNSFTAEKGKVTTTLNDESAFVELSYETEDGKTVKTDRFQVKSQSEKAVEFGSDWTLVDGEEDSGNYDADDYEQDNIVTMGDDKYLDTTFVDQFGDSIDNGDVEFESLDTSVAIVDKNTGKVIPREAGTVPVRAMLKDGGETVATKTVELEVKAEAEATSLSVDDSDVTVSKDLNDTVKISGEVLDQYGNVFTAANDNEVTVESDSDVVSVDQNSTVSVDENGKFNAELNVEKAGDATVTLSSDNVKDATVNVTVQKAGDVADYELAGVQNLDINGSDNKDTVETSDLNLYEVDKDGVRKGEANDVTYTVKNEDGNDVTEDAISNENALIADGLDKGKYTITAKVGSLNVAEDSFEVVDTTPETNYGVKLTNNNIALSSGEADGSGDGVSPLVNQLNEAFEVTENGSESNTSIASYNVASNNSDVLNFGGNNSEEQLDGSSNYTVGVSDGSAKLIINSVEIGTGEDTETVNVNETVTIDAEVNDADSFAYAIENAVSGDTITLDGDIESDVTVDQGGITINGGNDEHSIKGNTTIGTTNSGNKNAGVEDVTFENMTLKGNSEKDERAITIGYSDNITFDNVTFNDATRGVQGDNYGNPDHLTITNSTFNTEYGIAGTENTGLDKVEGNTFATSEEAVGVAGSASLGEEVKESASIAQTIAENNTDDTTDGTYVVDYGSSSDAEYNQDGNKVESD